MAAAAETVRKTKPSTTPERGERAGRAGLAERGAALRKNIEDVLADIDDVLEENAEEFVKEFVQRGGE